MMFITKASMKKTDPIRMTNNRLTDWYFLPERGGFNAGKRLGMLFSPRLHRRPDRKKFSFSDFLAAPDRAVKIVGVNHTLRGRGCHPPGFAVAD
ncbi:MAG: hypothetical protein GW936_01005 [Gallionella sp.]|nr:hypothetical protein [Gallionella sp.]NCS75214.1 hypothetical protein [Gallionella sp.]